MRRMRGLIAQSLVVLANATKMIFKHCCNSPMLISKNSNGLAREAISYYVGDETRILGNLKMMLDECHHGEG